MSIPTHHQPRSLLARLFLSPNERRLRAFWRLLGFYLLQFVITFLLFLPLGLFRLFDNRQFSILLFISQAASLIAVTLSAYLARRFLDRRSFISLGLRVDQQMLLDLLAGFFIPLFMMGLIFFLEYSFGWLTFEGFAWQFDTSLTILVNTSIMLLVFIIVGWHEELMYRGYLLQNTTDGLNLVWGLMISSFLFGLAHWENPNADLKGVLGILFAGLFLAFAYLRTKQLWLPIGLHIGWNFFEGTVFGFPVSGLGIASLLRQSTKGPDLVTGGAFGPEAGLILLPALLLGAGLVYGYTKLRPPR